MTEERTAVGREVEEALKEVLAHVRGDVALATRIVDDPSKVRILAVRKKLGLSRRRFAERYHLDPRTVQDWEQGRRTPDQAARVLLTVIEREPEAVERALTRAG
jgi:putative transcriptional regulator